MKEIKIMNTNKMELIMNETELVNGEFIPVVPDDSDNNHDSDK